MSSRRILAVIGIVLIAGVMYGASRRPSRQHDALPLPRFPSYFLQPKFVDDAFAAVGSVSADPDVSMVLVNHHLLASNFIARVMTMVASEQPCAVILVAPDHFDGGAAPVTSVIAQWPTPFGDIEPATDDISALAREGVVNLQAQPFVREHGITNITMFIKKALPQARLVPVIIRTGATRTHIDTLARAISQLPGRILIVGSFDFTHDATDAVARKNDARSVQLLQRGNPDDAEGVVVDSKPGIRLLLELARLRDLTFTVVDMSNAAQLLHDTSRTDVTSYITGTWAPAREVVH